MGRTRTALGTLAAGTAVVCIAAATASTSPTVGSSGALIPQSTQTDTAYANTSVPNVFATTKKTSCYTPEVPFGVDLAPTLGYSGESPCGGAANTGEDLGPYPTQAGSNPGYPAATPMLVKDHSESDIRVDPTDPLHVIGTSKWFVSPEGYNHLMGFYESFDGGQTFKIQGHIPGYEGWTDNTDPVGAFDSYGNFYFFDLGYQFFYNKDGSKNYTVGGSQEPNPTLDAEMVAVAVRPHGATSPTDWRANDIVASYDSKGNEPDKQWLTIDTGTNSPFKNRIYAMWVNFHTLTPVPYVSYADARRDGTHTPWSTPQKLPQPKSTPQGATYLLPHVTPDGAVYSTVTNFDPSHQFNSPVLTYVVKSKDGGATWSILPGTITIQHAPPLEYANTSFRDGITDTFAVGPKLDTQNHYPLYDAYEDYSAGVDNILLTASYDDGQSWSPPIQVNDNASLVDEFQPNLSVSQSGTVSVAWYDRRLPCPLTGREATYAGVALDPGAAGARNYCVNASVEFYDASLNPLGNNVRLTQHTWDPQLNSPHPGSPSGFETFIGDYFGNDWSSDGTDYFTFVSTYNDGSNPANRQQQVVASAKP
jgi:hypothetical protein